MIALRLKENTRVVGFFTMNTMNALLLVRFGNGRFRSLKPSAAKTGRRARSLDPVTQNLLHEATGVIWLPTYTGEEGTEKQKENKPAPRKGNEKTSADPVAENETGSPEQASLF